jgi:anti-anti-sigma regulatory factor
MSSIGASSNSIVKRIREQNSKYIPLLKPNVDIDDYVSTVIKEENSELYCNELSSYIIDINDVSVLKHIIITFKI